MDVMNVTNLNFLSIWVKTSSFRCTTVLHLEGSGIIPEVNVLACGVTRKFHL